MTIQAGKGTIGSIGIIILSTSMGVDMVSILAIIVC